MPNGRLCTSRIREGARQIPVSEPRHQPRLGPTPRKPGREPGGLVTGAARVPPPAWHP